jgi:hypothetical protein
MLGLSKMTKSRRNAPAHTNSCPDCRHTSEIDDGFDIASDFIRDYCGRRYTITGRHDPDDGAVLSTAQA